MERQRPIALVTGASRGIGRAAAIALAAAGHDVAITARTVREGEGRVAPRMRGGDVEELPVAGSLESTAAEIERRGARAHLFPMDLLDEGSVLAAADEVLAQLGHVDVLVNNAIVHVAGVHDRLLDLAPAVLAEVLEGNFSHQVRFVQRVLPGMIERGHGVIINLCSGAATTPPPAPPGQGGWGLAYAASKAAFGRLSGAINAEFWDAGVRSFDLDPGFVVTESARVRGGNSAVAERGFDPVPPEVAAAAITWTATSPDVARFRGKVIWSPRLVADLDLPTH